MSEKNHYIDNNEFYTLLSKALPYYKENKKWGPYDKEVGNTILQIMYNIKKRPNFIRYNGYHWECMQEKALLNVFKYITKYDLNKTNPFAYFTTIIHNAYATALRELNKKPTELPYDNVIISDMIDENDFEDFEEDSINKVDKDNKSKKLLSKIDEKELIQEVQNILNEM
jgi:hypothetical protein